MERDDADVNVLQQVRQDIQLLHLPKLATGVSTARWDVILLQTKDAQSLEWILNE